MTIEVPLTKGYVAIIDDEDADLICPFSWYVWDSKRGHFYAQRKVRDKTIFMHRAILGLTDRYVFADHIDHDGLNNRRSNLRPCSVSENGRNRLVQKNSPFGFKGVKLTRQGKYAADVQLNGRKTRVGVFLTAEDAARARDEAAIKLHGEFARLNFPVASHA